MYEVIWTERCKAVTSCWLSAGWLVAGNTTAQHPFLQVCYFMPTCGEKNKKKKTVSAHRPTIALHPSTQLFVRWVIVFLSRLHLIGLSYEPSWRAEAASLTVSFVSPGSRREEETAFVCVCVQNTKQIRREHLYSSFTILYFLTFELLLIYVRKA